jgi:hypothetical protein
MAAGNQLNAGMLDVKYLFYAEADATSTPAVGLLSNQRISTV